MNKKEIVILTVCLVFGFFLVYSPHFFNPYPIHVDEWHHISEALKIKHGDYTLSSNSFRIGFQVFLLFLSYIFDLVKTYEFFPAVWAVLTSLVLFFVTYKKSKNFWIGILSILFFVSLRSNVSIEGIWFFVPLTFSIPFIYLYIYFLSEFFETGRKNNLFFALLFMTLLIPVHVISLAFSIPIIFIYSILNWKFVLKNFKYLFSFLIIPFISILFFIFVTHIYGSSMFTNFFESIIFNKSIAENLDYQNSFLELYSFVGYLLAFYGGILFFKKRQNLIYIIWPVVCFIFIIFFKIFGISYFAPYHRMFYYFGLGLPFLSAKGLWDLFLKIKLYLIKINFSKFYKRLVFILFFFLVFFSTFYNYQNSKYPLYSFISDKEYNSLVVLSQFSSGNVLADPFISVGVYPIANKFPYANIYFDNPAGLKNTETFFYYSDCEWKKRFTLENNISYIVSKEIIKCDFKESLVDSGFYHIYIIR